MITLGQVQRLQLSDVLQCMERANMPEVGILVVDIMEAFWPLGLRGGKLRGVYCVHRRLAQVGPMRASGLGMVVGIVRWMRRGPRRNWAGLVRQGAGQSLRGPATMALKAWTSRRVRRGRV